MIVVGALHSPDIAIERLPTRFVDSLTPVPLDASLLSKLGPLLQAAPTLATNATVATAANLYSLTFSADVTTGLATGQYNLANAAGGGYRALAQGPAGIVEHGVLQPLDGLQTAAAALAIWQVLSVLTATYHLQAIQWRLGELSRGIQELERIVKGARRGRIQGKYVYLVNALERIQSNSLSPLDGTSLIHQLETIERELLEELQAIDGDLSHLDVEISKSEMPNVIGTNRDKALVQNMVYKAGSLLEERRVALLTRAVATQMLACLPGQQASAKTRVNQTCPGL
jgi:hypothetical protein